MAAPAPKRRLPIVGSPPIEETIERPAWQWVPLGAVATLLAWLLLAAAANALAASWLSGQAGDGAVAAATGVQVAALAIAAGLGGAFVGRLGASARAVHAALAGAVAAASAWLVAVAAPGGAAWGRGGAGLVLAVLVSIASIAACGGGWAGARLRRRRGA